MISTWHPIWKYLAALAATLCAYALYVSTVVPQIEGGQVSYRNTISSGPVAATNETALPMPDLPALSSLAADAWERGTCKRIQIEEGVVLFKDWTQKDDGSVEVYPFTLIIEPKMPPPRNARERVQPKKPIVIRADDRAELRFDRPFVIGSSQSGKLQACNLKGFVHIYRQPAKEGDEDAFNIWTANVQLTPQRIVSLEKVHFEFGNHSGVGSNLMIDLEHEAHGSAIRSQFETIKGFSRLELAFVERIRLVPGAKATSTSPAKQAVGLSTAPIDITCDGPFVFDFRQRSAEFLDRVVVTRLDQVADQVFAEKLRLLFGVKQQAEDVFAVKPESEDIVLEQIELIGAPARLVLPSQKANVSAATLSYNVLHNEIRGSDPNTVIVEQDGQRFESAKLQYRIRQGGRLGPLIAEGAGRLITTDKSKSDAMHLSWQNHLAIEPRDSRQKIHVEGKVIAELPNQTLLTGEMLDIWLQEKSTSVVAADGSPRQKWEYEPIEVVVDQNVQFAAADIRGATGMLKLIWPSVAIDSNVGQMPQSQSEPLNATRRTMRVPFVSPQAFNSIAAQNSEPPSQQRQEPVPSASLIPVEAKPNNSSPQHHRIPATKDDKRIEVEGDSITIQMSENWRDSESPISSSNKQVLPAFRQVDLAGRVFVRKPSKDADQSVFSVSADSLTLTPQGNELYEAKVEGNGRIESPQLTLVGSRLHLDQLANRVWVVGPGQMDLASNHKTGEQGAPQLAGVEQAQRVNVTWRGGMIFDGEKVYFEEEVRSSSAQPGKEGSRTQIRTLAEGMSLQLSRRIDLTETQQTSPQTPAVEIVNIVLVNEIATSQRAFNRQGDANSPPQPVVLEKSTFDSLGQQSDKQLVVVPHVIMNVTTGDLRADGPGGIISWQRSENGEKKSPFALASTNDEREHAPAITYVHANFDKHVIGNTNDEKVRIEGNVRTLHASVTNWDARLNPDTVQVPKGGTRITCEQIEITHWQPRGAEHPITQLTATGNTRVIGELFEATASRLKFDENDGFLTIEGDERNAANLWHQPNRNSSRNHLSADQIRYNPSDGQTIIDDIKHVSISSKK